MSLLQNLLYFTLKSVIWSLLYFGNVTYPNFALLSCIVYPCWPLSTMAYPTLLWKRNFSKLCFTLSISCLCPFVLTTHYCCLFDVLKAQLSTEPRRRWCHHASSLCGIVRGCYGPTIRAADLWLELATTRHVIFQCPLNFFLQPFLGQGFVTPLHLSRWSSILLRVNTFLNTLLYFRVYPCWPLSTMAYWLRACFTHQNLTHICSHA